MCRMRARSSGRMNNILIMKRFLLLLCILTPCLSCTGTRGGATPSSSISDTISECRHYDGADYLKLGRLATGALKGVAGMVGKEDSDVLEAVSLMEGIRGLTVFSFDDCSDEDKASISGKLTDALADSEVLLEVSDSGRKMKLYGTYDEESGQVRDFVLYAPSESALICIKGSVSMESITRIASDE